MNDLIGKGTAEDESLRTASAKTVAPVTHIIKIESVK